MLGNTDVLQEEREMRPVLFIDSRSSQSQAIRQSQVELRSTGHLTHPLAHNLLRDNIACHNEHRHLKIQLQTSGRTWE